MCVCMCMCTCMYVCVCIYLHIYIYIYTHYILSDVHSYCQVSGCNTFYLYVNREKAFLFVFNFNIICLLRHVE